VGTRGSLDLPREYLTRSGHCLRELDQLNVVHVAGTKGKVQIIRYGLLVHMYKLIIIKEDSHCILV